MTKIYKLVIFFQEKKTLTRTFIGKDYACINGEHTKCPTTTYNTWYDNYVIGPSQNYYRNLKHIKKEMLSEIIF